MILRPDLTRIANWIKPKSSVLDLGCGNGELLVHLRKNLKAQCTGLEIDNDCVINCINNGVDIIQKNIEEGLALFDNKQFDTVVLSQTLQSIYNIEQILLEMIRVANFCIVSFPNFGYWLHGLMILNGRMPVTKQMPYQWYNSPNIHLCTLKDFEKLIRILNLKILERATFNSSGEIRKFPSWRSTLLIYRLGSI